MSTVCYEINLYNIDHNEIIYIVLEKKACRDIYALARREILRVIIRLI